MKFTKYIAFTIILVCLIGYAVFFRRFGRSDKQFTPIVIGILLPLNPDLMAVANKMKNGIELAKEDLLNKYDNKINIELIYENGCFENESAAAVQKFIHKGVSIIGGSFCLFGHIPILPLTEANPIIAFNTAANPDVVLNKSVKFFVNIKTYGSLLHLSSIIQIDKIRDRNITFVFIHIRYLQF